MPVSGSSGSVAGRSTGSAWAGGNCQPSWIRYCRAVTAPTSSSRAGTRRALLSRKDVDIVTGACPHDCPDTCAWQVAVERPSGRALDIWGHPEHPITNGSLCPKVDRYLERSLHPGRLTQPLRRVGPKGSGKFEAISWSEAMSHAAQQLQSIVATHGPQSILPYSYGGTMGYLQGEGIAARFFNRLGASRLARTICAEAGVAGYRYTIGAAMGMDISEVEHARLIIIWGSNTLTSNLHYWQFVQRAKAQGARVVVIDPIRTITARKADSWIGLAPGTDGALALAMMHVIIGEELHDPQYVAEHTLGFEGLRARVLDWTPQRASEITSIPASTIVALARAYAQSPAAAIRINYGMQRHAGGGMAVRTIACLPALVGAWKQRGGGILLSNSGSFPVDLRPLQFPELVAKSADGRSAGTRVINMSRLGDALALDPRRLARAHHRPRAIDRCPEGDAIGAPIHGLIVYNSNPAAVAPDQKAVLEGLARDDLFTVVLEHFQTDTADMADLVLPATTQIEHWDLVKPYGHLYIMLNRPAIAPLGDCRPNSEIFRGLAQAMGFADDAFRGDDLGDLEAFWRAQSAPQLRSVQWSDLLERGWGRLDVPEPFRPFAEGGFPTPSGRCEFESRSCARSGYDALPDFTPPKETPPSRAGHGRLGPRPEHTPALALTCLSVPAHNFLNSSFVNVERLAAREGQPCARLHVDDARCIGVGEGDWVELRNALGRLRLPVRPTSDIVRGVVAVPSIWWRRDTADGYNANVLVHQGETDMGGAAVFYDVSAWASKVDMPAP